MSVVRTAVVLAALAAVAVPAFAHADRCDRMAQRLVTVEAAQGTTSPAARRLARSYVDRCVHLNQLQVLGTHNSYHIEDEPALMSLLLNFSPDLFKTLQYSHPPLDQQFDSEGIRQIEIDVFADPQGGLYHLRRTLPFIGKPAEGPDELLQPGLKVLHVQDVDFNTTCLTFVDCLHVVKQWSDTHRGHMPIMILIEAKDDVIPDPLSLGFTIPLPFDAEQLNAIDAEIHQVFPARQLITPDDVRGGAATLDEAVRTRGWPLLRKARGKVLFCLDNASRRNDYLVGHPVLKDRVLFTNADPGDPDAAFVERNDSKGSFADIQTLVAQGYVVRTRADADTVESRNDDPSTSAAAIDSGAQWVSTDYPEPDPRFSTYSVAIPGGVPARCNPVNAPAGCRAGALERLP
jgi:hypothetical protein